MYLQKDFVLISPEWLLFNAVFELVSLLIPVLEWELANFTSLKVK